MPSPTAVNVTSDSPTPAGDPSVVPVIPSTVVNAVAPSTSSSVLAPVDVSGAGRIPYASIPPGTDTEDSASGGSSRMPVEIQAATMREGLNGSPSDEGDFSGRAPTRPGSRNSFTPQGLSNATTSPAGGACPSHHRQGRMTHVAHLLDTRTLAEASRNLSQTLRHLSYQAHNSSKAVDNEV